jgi:hypothetical protein
MTNKLQHFTAYTGNIKEDIRELTLGPCTAIIGDEATYKSAIATGIRLALTGEYDPVGKLPNELLKLAATPNAGIDVMVAGPDGSASWSLRVTSDGKAKRPEPPHFEGALRVLTEAERACVMPTDSVRALLKDARGDRKLREAFLRRFGASLSDVPVPPLLDEAATAIWHDACGVLRSKLPADASGDTLLAGLSEYFRKESGAKRREITPLQSSIAQRKASLMKATLEEGLTPECLPEIEDTIEAWIRYQSAASDREAHARVVADLENQRADLQAATEREAQLSAEHGAQTQELAHVIAQAQKARDQAFDAYISSQRRLASAEVNVDVYSRLETEGKASCPYCATKFASLDPITKTRAVFEERRLDRVAKCGLAAQDLDAAEAALAAAQATLAAFNVESATTLQTVRARSVSLARAVQDLETSEKQLAAKLGRAAKKPSGLTLLELQQQAARLKTVADAKTTLTRESLRITQLEQEFDTLKKLENEATEMQKMLMTRVARTASEEVSRGMSGGRRARLDPMTCDWYVQRPDGQEYGPFGVLCGTEKTALLLGLVAAWTRGSPLRVAVLDDEDMVGLSTKGLRDFRDQCAELYASGDFTQVILVSNRVDLWLDEAGDPLSEVADWTLVVRGLAAA